MKKILSFALVAVLLLSLAACNAPNPEDIRGTQSDKELSLGVVNGLKYENSFIGIGCQLPEGWTFKSEAEILELNNIAQDVMTDDLQEALKSATVVYDMMATSPSQTDNILVNLEKVNNIQLLALDLKKNCETLYPSIEDSLKNFGYQDFTHSVEDVNIGNKSFTALKLQASLYGVKMYQTTFFIKCNGYLAGVAVTAMSEAQMQSILQSFYILN